MQKNEIKGYIHALDIIRDEKSLYSIVHAIAMVQLLS